MVSCRGRTTRYNPLPPEAGSGYNGANQVDVDERNVEQRTVNVKDEAVATLTDGNVWTGI